MVVETAEKIQPYDDLLWAWLGYWHLSAGRPMGFNGPLRIPFSEISAYCLIRQFNFERQQDFVRYIVSMDDVHMAHYAAEREKDRIEKEKQSAKEASAAATARQRR